MTIRPYLWKWGKCPTWYSPMNSWPQNSGKYWKRKLSKARRRNWKQGRPWRGETEGQGLYRGFLSYQSTVNYKTY